MALCVSIDNVTNVRTEMTKWRRNGYMILNGAAATTMEKISNDGVVTTMDVVATTMATAKTSMERNLNTTHRKDMEIPMKCQGRPDEMTKWRRDG